MVSNLTTRPLRQTPTSSSRPAPMNWRQKGVGISRIIFGLVYIVAATLKWQPQFQNTFVAQVSAAQDGQPALIQGWIAFWTHLVSVNPLLFARIEATTETAIALFLILGLFSNLTSIVGILLSLGIWSIPEGFGGPYIPGHSTDIGTAFPYALVFAVLLCISAGRYYGLDQWLTSRLGRLGFLASGSFEEGNGSPAQAKTRVYGSRPSGKAGTGCRRGLPTTSSDTTPQAECTLSTHYPLEQAVPLQAAQWEAWRSPPTTGRAIPLFPAS